MGQRDKTILNKLEFELLALKGQLEIDKRNRIESPAYMGMYIGINWVVQRLLTMMAKERIDQPKTSTKMD